MNNFELLERLGVVEPPDLVVTAHVAAALEGAAANEMVDTGPSHRRRRRRMQYTGAASVFAAIILVVGVVTLSGGRLTAPLRTSWQAGQPLSVARTSRMGTWHLLDDEMSGTWQQSASGPPPGYLECPSTSACYAMSGDWASAMAGAPLLSESLYVSNNVGASWIALPMPSSFAPTSPLDCAGATACEVGGTYDGQPVLVTTSDGGHSFTIDPLPAGVGSIYALSCSSSQNCDGLAASANPVDTPINATLLSTSNGGTTFTDSPILAGDSMQLLSCSSSLDCTAIGASDVVRDSLTGIAATTTDGGQTWTATALPQGFGVDGGSQLSCADALHCSLVGLIAIKTENPPACATITYPKGFPTPTNPTTPAPTVTKVSPVVQAVADYEARVAAAAFAVQNTSGSSIYSCTSGTQTLISDVASTSDGGLTWMPERLAPDVPQPQLSGLSCPTANECWAAGSDAIPEAVDGGYSGGSPMLLGTTDGGATWSKVTFSVPSGSPNYDGQSYLSIGFISCPTVTVCGALGAGAQGSSTEPFYSLVAPASVSSSPVTSGAPA